MIDLLDLLKIRDTVNIYYWDDLMDDEYPMRIIATYSDAIYEGIFHNYESYSNEPKIILGSYVVKNRDGIIIKDYSNDKTKCIILNSANADTIEIIYSVKSSKCDDLKDLCDSNRDLF